MTAEDYVKRFGRKYEWRVKVMMENIEGHHVVLWYRYYQTQRALNLFLTSNRRSVIVERREVQDWRPVGPR